MQPRTIEERVSMLERQMQEMRNLPERVTSLESQVLQLRQEMRDEFSATRSEFRELAAAVGTLRGELASRGELAAAVTTVRGELVSKGELAQAVTTLRGDIAVAVTTLSKAIADTNTHMRTLHEETISRIATMGEGRQPRKKR